MPTQPIEVTVGADTVTASCAVTVSGPNTAQWLEVQLGPGSNNGARRIVVPPDDQYPVGGVYFYINGSFNRNDPTGPREGSVFQFFPIPTLTGGEVLRAEWTDEGGVARVSEYLVPEDPDVDPIPDPGGRPDATTTGHDGNLTRTFGGVTITQGWLDTNNDGSRVLENVRFTGRVNVRVNDLTIRNFAIEGGVYGVDNDVFSGNPTTGLVLEDGELTGQSSSGLLVSNCTAQRLHVHHQGADAIKAFRDVTIEDCYVHHLGSNAGSHSDGVQMVNGGPLTVRRCNFDMPKGTPGFTNSQVFMIASSGGPIVDVSIRDCWLNGGSISVQIHSVTGVAECVNNRFGRDYIYGLFSTTGPVNRSGNVWDDTGLPV